MTDITAHTLKSPQNHKLSDILHYSGRWIIVSDILALCLAFVCGGLCAWIANASSFREGWRYFMHPAMFEQLIIFAGLGVLAILWLDARGHYRHRLPFWEAVGHILAVAFIGFLVCGFVQFASQGTFSRLWLGLSWTLFAIFLFLGRGCVRHALIKRSEWQIPGVLVGTGSSAEALIHALNREPQMGFTIVEQISPQTLYKLDEAEKWYELMHHCGASHVFLALDGGGFDQYRRAIKALVRGGLPCSIIPPWLGLPTGTLSPHHFLMHDVLLMHNTNRLTLPLPRFLKRGFDIVAAGMALLCLSPLFVGVAVAVRRDGGPAFFRQERIGKNGRIFICYKFRSMRMDAEAHLDEYLAQNPEAAEEWRLFQKLKNDIRITPVGHFIRRTSIDELPQLLNVLKGDMSLVGPRPITLGQEEYYGDDFMYYESVRPGITGPWQVSGRNKLTFSERVQLECCYAQNWSFWMDIVILLKTLPALFKRDNVF